MGGLGLGEWWAWKKHRLFKVWFWPFAAALVAAGGWIIWKTWVWVLQ